MRKITWLDNEEPREAGGSKTLWKKSSLAVEIDKSEVHSPSKKELTEGIAQLKRQLAEEESTWSGSKKSRPVGVVAQGTASNAITVVTKVT